jgi:S-adenosylmethionine hydrolase
VTGGPISFLSDYGLDDEFVGIVHRVLAAHAPGVPVVDITHGVAAHDVRAGALTLWRAAPWLGPGVVLAVVDPGVGGPRRGVAVEVAAASVVLVGPDNGLLLPAALALGGATRAVELAADPIPGRGATFAGRDVFAPACARVATGADLLDLGRPVDPDTLEGDPVPAATVGRDGVRGEVLWVDRFGNAQLSARPADADHLGPSLVLRSGGRQWPAARAAAYAELAPDQVGLVTDSYGLLAVSLNGAPAADRLGLARGATVWIVAGPDRSGL